MFEIIGYIGFALIMAFIVWNVQRHIKEELKNREREHDKLTIPLHDKTIKPHVWNAANRNRAGRRTGSIKILCHGPAEPAEADRRRRSTTEQRILPAEADTDDRLGRIPGDTRRTWGTGRAMPADRNGC